MAPQSGFLALVAILASASVTVAASCNTTTLNTTVYEYPITVEGTTIFDVANATGRGVCDIGRYNAMADVTIIPNVGQSIVIPAEVCEPDHITCIVDNYNTTRDCVYGGPRLYYTVNGDTYAKIANRLNITVESLADSTTVNASAPLEVGEFLKVPVCTPTQCVLQPFQFDYGVYKDLADKHGTTVGQIMMLSATYNYTQSLYTGSTPPTIDIPINCTALSSNLTVLS